MASLIFRKSINFSKVKIYSRGYLPLKLQEDGMAIAPNGAIYFKPIDYRSDFSTGLDLQKAWFIHELTHVWQHQLGYHVFIRGIAKFGLDYSYKLENGKKLTDYNMEAQGEILADYFSIFILKNRTVARNKLAIKNPEAYTKEMYEATLVDFLKDPSDRKNLP